MLNLPQVYTLPTGTVTYTYDADGTKLRKVSIINGTTSTEDYISGIQHKSDGTIDFIQTEEGRALNSGGAYHYEYSLTDHLGNERLTFDTYSGTTSTVQTDDYYPFGLEISSGTVVSPKNEYLYNKKELQEELGQYDYGARFYDPVIGRWTTIDPLAEKYFGITGYSYCNNLPNSLNDRNGKDVDDRSLTDDKQKEGLIKFANTKEGTKYLDNYLKHGQSFTIKLGNKTYVFTNNGKSGALSNNRLAFGSAKNLGTDGKSVILGLTFQSKPANSEGHTVGVNSDGMSQTTDPSYDVGKNPVIHQIWIQDGISADETAGVIGHEAFVHDQVSQHYLLELRRELNNGTIQPGTAEYGKKLDLVEGNGNADHQRLANGQVTDYENLAQQLDQLNNTTKFIKAYNDDVARHGKSE